MNEHAHPLSMSERADELEEEKMHEMERIITRSTYNWSCRAAASRTKSPVASASSNKRTSKT